MQQRLKNLILYGVVSILLSCGGRYYKNSSSSMSETIKQGERFYVKKTSQFKRNDIVVFNYYGNDYSSQPNEYGEWRQHWEKRVFRLIAMSGDVIEIRKGNLFVNNKEIKPLPTQLDEYVITAIEPIQDFPEREIPEQIISQNSNSIVYSVQLTSAQAETFLKRKPEIVTVNKVIREYPEYDTVLCKPFDTCRWSIDNYGPLTIPSPGETININSGNLKLYKNIADISTGAIRITEVLYFLLGDNRHGAEDSRYIGLISHSNMYGVVN